MVQPSHLPPVVQATGVSRQVPFQAGDADGASGLAGGDPIGVGSGDRGRVVGEVDDLVDVRIPDGAIGVDPGPPTGAVRGRWRFRPPCTATTTTFTDKSCSPPPTGTFLPATRELRAVPSSLMSRFHRAGLLTTLHTGLPVGEHGIFEWIYYEPEVDAVGTNVALGSAQAVSAPVTVNGRVASPGKAHFFRIHARMGEHLVIVGELVPNCHPGPYAWTSTPCWRR